MSESHKLKYLKADPYKYPFFFKKFLLDIFFVYISNAIPKVPYTLPLHCSPTPYSCLLALSFPCTGAYKVYKNKGPLYVMMVDWTIFCYICS